MVSIEEALDLITNQKVKIKTERRSLDDSLDYFLAKDIHAPINLPPFDNSAMDGFAIRGRGPQFDIKGIIPAGTVDSYSLDEGEAMRIFTGGKVPKGATAVIMQEKTLVENNLLRINDEVVEGKNIRIAGGELSKGQEVFKKGHRITPATIGLLGSLGLESLDVTSKPKTAILSTGDELKNPGAKLREGQIYESNSFALASALNRFGFLLNEKTKAPDHLDEISRSIGVYLDRNDVVLISGGISVGDYDFVKEALEENGVETIFYKVFQKPGKPLFFGKKGPKFVFALPGNPASSLTCFYVYVLPLLNKLAGGAGTGLLRVNLPLAHDYDLANDRPAFLKSDINRSEVSILDRQGSSMIHSLAIGNALTLIKGPVKLRTGDMVECLLI